MQYKHTILFEKSEKLLLLLLDLTPSLEKFFRYTIGQKLLDLSLQIQINVNQAEVHPKGFRYNQLYQIIGDSSALKTISYFAWKKKLLNETNFMLINELLAEISTLAYGWIKKEKSGL